jgi:uncharacterized protein YcaQ
MTRIIHLTNQQARRFLLAKHGLWPPRALDGRGGVMAVFDRLACIQFDPLNIVARNADLVLQSRVADYRSDMLYALAYDERWLHDYWDKMMAYLPMRDWPRFALSRAYWRQRHARRLAQHAEHIQTILDVIRERGPVSSLDFEEQHNVGWKTDWRWGRMKAAKAILEMLADTGDLMVSHRLGARRYYDLRDRVVPEAILTRTPVLDKDEYLRWRLARRCKGVGLVGPAIGGSVWVGVGKAPERARAIETLVAQGEMVPVKIEGDPRTYHMLTADLSYLEQARSAHRAAGAAIIAPLDNLLWPRQFIERLFGFSYVWEVYKPVDERQYGYYVLPVLYGDRFVARFDAKLDRGSGVLHILNWHWESGQALNGDMAGALSEALTDFLAFLDAGSAVAAEGVDAAITELAA